VNSGGEKDASGSPRDPLFSKEKKKKKKINTTEFLDADIAFERGRGKKEFLIKRKGEPGPASQRVLPRLQNGKKKRRKKPPQHLCSSSRERDLSEKKKKKGSLTKQAHNVLRVCFFLMLKKKKKKKKGRAGSRQARQEGKRS